jgi:hypothetical protein
MVKDDFINSLLNQKNRSVRELIVFITRVTSELMTGVYTYIIISPLAANVFQKDVTFLSVEWVTKRERT